MAFDSWLCNPQIQEDREVHFYHPTETPTLQQDIFIYFYLFIYFTIFTRIWVEADGKSSSSSPSLLLDECVERHLMNENKILLKA